MSVRHEVKIANAEAPPTVITLSDGRKLHFQVASIGAAFQIMKDDGVTPELDPNGSPVFTLDQVDVRLDYVKE